MSRPVITVDIDDVLFPFIGAIAAHHNLHHGTTLSEEDFFSFDLMEVWGGTQEETERIIENFMLSDYIDLIPVEGAKQALERLSNDYTVVLVTARNGIFEDNTRKWLRQHLSDLFEDVVFAGNQYDGRGYRTKGEIGKDLGALLHIDDHPDNIRSVLGEGIDGILFGERQWTMEAHDLLHTVKHCRNWDETLEYIYGDWRQRTLSR